MEGFYPTHDEVCRASLRPMIRAWLAVTGGAQPVDQVLDGFVSTYVQESQAQLRVVADEHDVESLAPALERVLRRWEAGRAEALVDGLIKGRAA